MIDRADLARGKCTEIDHLNGYVVQRGRVYDVLMPVNQTPLTPAHLLENERGAVG